MLDSLTVKIAAATRFFVRGFKFQPKPDQRTLVSGKRYILQTVIMKVSVGQPAPDFALFNTQKEKVSLSDLRGRNVVLLFFPFAFSSVCTAELCNVRDNMNRYSGLNAEVLGISVDSLYTLKKFREDQNLNFTLLSDFNKDVSTAYGALYETFSYEMKGVSKRAAFIIDSKGIIRYAEVLENAGEQPDFAELQQALRTLSSATV